MIIENFKLQEQPITSFIDDWIAYRSDVIEFKAYLGILSEETAERVSGRAYGSVMPRPMDA
jgi:hypothetical protein